MGITRPPYPAEFKQQIIELYRSGRTPGQAVKTNACKQSGTSWQKPRLGSPERPTRMPGGLRVRE